MICSKAGKWFPGLHDLLFHFRVFSVPFEKKTSGLWLAFIKCYELLNTLQYFTQIKEKFSWQFSIDYTDLQLFILFFYVFIYFSEMWYLSLWCYKQLYYQLPQKFSIYGISQKL